VRRLAVVLVGLIGATVVSLCSPGSGTPADAPASPSGASLSADPQGWAFHPSVAVANDGTVYVAWTQHTRPESWQHAGTWVKRWAHGSWQALDGRIGHTHRDPGGRWTEGYAPSLAILDGTPYVAWYEGGGYGWGVIGSTDIRSSVFVAHWDGSRWTLDANAGMPNGALNTDPDIAARTPALSAVGGVLHAAWIEVRRIPERGTYNVVVVKRLTGGRWLSVGPDLRAESADSTRMLDLALVDAGGLPHVAWSEAATANAGGRAQVHVAKWTGREWTRIGRSLNVSRSGFANYVALAASGTALHLAWQERTVAGNNQIYVKNWDGSGWTAAAGSLNVDPARGEAGRPALASDGSRLWLAWTEGTPGQRGGLYARALGPGGWGAPVGPLNADREAGAPDGPALGAGVGGVFLTWAEKNPPPATKQVYVRALP
jgi:hypothetical protein